MPTDRAVFAPTESRLLWFGRLLRAHARREWLDLVSYRMWLFSDAIKFFIGAVSLVYVARFIGAAPNPHLARWGGDYLAFSVTGLLMAQLQLVGVNALNQQVRNAQLMGHMEAQLATPAPPWIVLGVAPVAEFGAAAAKSAAYMVGASFVLGVRFGRANFTSLLVGVPLILAAFGGLGLLTAAGTMLYRRANPIPPILAAGSMVLSGVAFPRSVLPPSLRLASKVLPLTHALEVLRGSLLRGETPYEMKRQLLYLAGFAILLTPLGFMLFRYALARARADGSLTHY